jgi:hypothetical protein
LPASTGQSVPPSTAPVAVAPPSATAVDTEAAERDRILVAYRALNVVATQSANTGEVDEVELNRVATGRARLQLLSENVSNANDGIPVTGEPVPTPLPFPWP